MKKIFRKKQIRPNLLKCQKECVEELRNSTTLCVLKSDKNLGPCILERDDVINYAIHDHLSDRSTYTRLTEKQADSRVTSATKQIIEWCQSHKHHLPKREKQFIMASSNSHDKNGKLRTATFYIMPKVHKKPLKTRPVCAATNCNTEGFSKWLDRQLQPIGRETKCYLKSSTHLIQLLQELPDLPPTAMLFTCDAVSMYTNIDTKHALRMMRTQVPAHILQGLQIVMENNVFKFGDTFWLQKDGTAMGTPLACMWATIYFSIHEAKLLEEFKEFLIFLKRYIDDGFGIWNWTGTDKCKTCWDLFHRQMNTFGKLKWEFIPLSKTVDFLDLTLTIRKDRVQSTLFEKAMNLYLYLPPHSAHPPGVLKGLIAGMVLRILRLTSDPDERKAHGQGFFNCLRARGYLASTLLTY
jgi:hypothetical protein